MATPLGLRSEPSVSKYGSNAPSVGSEATDAAEDFGILTVRYLKRKPLIRMALPRMSRGGRMVGFSAGAFRPLMKTMKGGACSCTSLLGKFENGTPKSGPASTLRTVGGK